MRFTSIAILVSYTVCSEAGDAGWACEVGDAWRKALANALSIWAHGQVGPLMSQSLLDFALRIPGGTQTSKVSLHTHCSSEDA